MQEAYPSKYKTDIILHIESFSIIRQLKCTKYQKKSTTVHHRPKDVNNEQNQYQIVSYKRFEMTNVNQLKREN